MFAFEALVMLSRSPWSANKFAAYSQPMRSREFWKIWIILLGLPSRWSTLKGSIFYGLKRFLRDHWLSKR